MAETKFDKLDAHTTGIRQALRKIHPLTYIGAGIVVVSFAANYYILSATPAALWNDPRSVREQYVVLGLRIAGIAFVLIGRGIVLSRETKAKREQKKERQEERRC